MALPANGGISLDGVSRVFGDGTGLHPTSVAIKNGEFISILGPSGCGKSTLLRCVAGLETPDTGTITFDETEVFNAERRVNLPPNRRGLSMVFQDLALWPHMTVAGNVEFPLTTRSARTPSSERKKRVAEALEMVGISDKADRRPHELSGGQQQRVAIARAIVSRPRLLLMDEPLSALDAALRIQIRSEITALARELGLTVIYVTHDQSEALAMSDRVMVMDVGRVRQFASPVEIYERPGDEFIANFVGFSNPLPDGTRVRPENVTVFRPGSGPPEALAAEVVDVQYVGGHYEVKAKVAGSPRPWLVYSQQPLRIGDQIAVSPSPISVSS